MVVVAALKAETGAACAFNAKDSRTRFDSAVATSGGAPLHVRIVIHKRATKTHGLIKLLEVLGIIEE